MSSSRRPSARAAMEPSDTAAAALLHPSSPRSKKRSSSSSSARRAGDRRPARSPNPSFSPRGGDSGYAPSSRKSDRKRKPRSLALAVHASSGGGGGPGSVQKLWNDADEIALLAGAIAFRVRNGFAPRLPDMGVLFESLRGSISSHIDQPKVYYKLKRIKSKFLHAPPLATSSPHERRVRVLCANLWGTALAPPAGDDADAEEADERVAEEGYIGGDLDVGVRLPVVSEVLGDYWRKNGRVLSGVSLEKGLALVGAEEGREVESKWKRQLEAEMQTQGRRHDLAKESNPFSRLTASSATIADQPPRSSPAEAHDADGLRRRRIPWRRATSAHRTPEPTLLVRGLALPSGSSRAPPPRPPPFPLLRCNLPSRGHTPHGDGRSGVPPRRSRRCLCAAFATW